jgi:hypothetical protein
MNLELIENIPYYLNFKCNLFRQSIILLIYTLYNNGLFSLESDVDDAIVVGSFTKLYSLAQRDMFVRSNNRGRAMFKHPTTCRFHIIVRRCSFLIRNYDLTFHIRTVESKLIVNTIL